MRPPVGRGAREPQALGQRGRVAAVRSDGRVDVRVGQVTYMKCDLVVGSATSPALVLNDRVLIMRLEGRPDEAIVLGRITP